MIKTSRCLGWILITLAFLAHDDLIAQAPNPATEASKSRATTENTAETDQPRLTQTLSKNAVRVAEPFRLRVDVITPPGAEVTFPPVPSNWGDFYVVDHRDTRDLPIDRTHRRWSREITLEALTTDSATIPSMEIQVVVGNQRTTLATKPESIRIIRLVEDQADPRQIRDLQPPIDVTPPLEKNLAWLWWTIGSVSTLGLLAVVITGMSRRKKWIDPSQWALTQLQHVRSRIESPRHEETSDEAQWVTTEVSRILKEFLALQLDLTAPYQTTDELVRDLKQQQSLPPSLRESLCELFSMADEVKFAGVSLSLEEARQTVDRAESLVAEFSHLQSSSSPTEDMSVPSRTKAANQNQSHNHDSNRTTSGAAGDQAGENTHHHEISS